MITSAGFRSFAGSEASVSSKLYQESKVSERSGAKLATMNESPYIDIYIYICITYVYIYIYIHTYIRRGFCISGVDFLELGAASKSRWSVL